VNQAHELRALLKAQYGLNKPAASPLIEKQNRAKIRSQRKGPRMRLSGPKSFFARSVGFGLGFGQASESRLDRFGNKTQKSSFDPKRSEVLQRSVLTEFDIERRAFCQKRIELTVASLKVRTVTMFTCMYTPLIRPISDPVLFALFARFLFRQSKYGNSSRPASPAADQYDDLRSSPPLARTQSEVQSELIPAGLVSKYVDELEVLCKVRREHLLICLSICVNR